MYTFTSAVHTQRTITHGNVLKTRESVRNATEFTESLNSRSTQVRRTTHLTHTHFPSRRPADGAAPTATQAQGQPQDAGTGRRSCNKGNLNWVYCVVHYIYFSLAGSDTYIKCILPMEIILICFIYLSQS
ncbi:hypothetical protein E2C01_101708 [Portunus trituberculatus]|uniref:Uncharacterized protein n=1 Tax=Portunus trituberculatus TaxID=210409 RepID=A0A5B7KGE3_PORTR|nr:hypothetical protein [Portunus trituberculatus]